MKLPGLLVERVNMLCWLVSAECFSLSVSRLCNGLGRRRLSPLFGYLPILYQFTHSRSFLIRVKRVFMNDEWQVLTATILMLNCQYHEILNQKSQFVTWIEAGTSRNRTHSLTLRQSSRILIFIFVCVNYSGWVFEQGQPSLIQFFCVITPRTSMLTLSSCSKPIWCPSQWKFC